MANPSELAKQANKLATELIIFANMLIDGKMVPEDNKVIPEKREHSVGEKPLDYTVKEPEVKKVVKPLKNTYDNDPKSPTYDPEPFMQVDKVAPRNKPKNVKIAKGTIRVCEKCQKPTVIANKDIVGDLRLSDFDILDKAYGWADKVEVNKKGGICVTCPLCGTLNLWLLGKPFNKQPSTDTGSL